MCVREFHEVYNFEKGQDCSSCEKVLQSVASSRQYLHKLCYVWNMEKNLCAHSNERTKKGLSRYNVSFKNMLVDKWP